MSVAVEVDSILKIGTYQMAVMAKTLNKPFYVVAESFKFVRMFPLNQQELPNRINVSKLTYLSLSLSPHLLASIHSWMPRVTQLLTILHLTTLLYLSLTLECSLLQQ